MVHLRYIAVALLIVSVQICVLAQSTKLLRAQIEAITSANKAKVGVSIIGDDGKDTLSLKGDERFPLQSVFKFHIGLTVLSVVKKGKISLDQIVKIEKKELMPGLHSPLREKYPEGASLPVSEILKYTVSQSDNVGCDVLLRLIGGPKVVEDYFKMNGYKDISIKINEEVMQANWDLQFQNWTTPKEAAQILLDFYENKKGFLTKDHQSFFWNVMKETETGKNRLKGQLPAATVVAHKTGSSGANKDGLIAAVNDIGIIFLPNGRYFVISVFVSDAYETSETCEKIISDIAKVTWDYFKVKQ